MRTFTNAFSTSVQHKFHASKDYNQFLKGGGHGLGDGTGQTNKKKPNPTPIKKPNNPKLISSMEINCNK